MSNPAVIGGRAGKTTSFFFVIYQKRAIKPKRPPRDVMMEASRAYDLSMETVKTRGKARSPVPRPKVR